MEGQTEVFAMIFGKEKEKSVFVDVVATNTGTESNSESNEG